MPSVTPGLTVHYTALLARDGDRTAIEFPDCSGCVTFADASEDVADTAREALEGWLEAELIQGETPPRPSATIRAARGAKRQDVDVSPALAARLQLRWAREAAGLSQAELAKRADMTRQQLSRIESSSETNLTMATIDRLARALGVAWSIQIGGNSQK